jgi:beta-galactosidase
MRSRLAGLHEETVEAYSNCEEIELFLNGKTLGIKPRNPDDSPRIWKIAYEPGALKAVGRTRDVIVAEHELRTAGKPAKIIPSVDRTRLTPVWDDVVFVTATIADQSGIPVHAATDLVSFEIVGPGVIAAGDSGDTSSAEPFQASERRAYQGCCYAMLKARGPKGKLTVSGL